MFQWNELYMILNRNDIRLIKSKFLWITNIDITEYDFYKINENLMIKYVKTHKFTLHGAITRFLF